MKINFLFNGFHWIVIDRTIHNYLPITPQSNLSCWKKINDRDSTSQNSHLK